MKNFKIYMGAIAVIAMLFTSCSQDETEVLQEDATATLSFETVLNDLMNNSRQQADLGIPACGDDEPAYVHVVLTGEENVGTMEVPLVVNVHPSPIQENGEDVWFTQESADLELTPGDYVLNYFAVYNSDDEMIWLAPTTDGDLADFVDNPLPLDISLGAGVKKYVDVEVLCFDDRMVNEYGYLFFDIIGKEAFEFCVFANYCDEDGRHYPAYYSFEVYMGTDDTGDLLYSDLYPVPSTDGEDPSVAPLCFALPNPTDLGGDVPYIYWRATLEDWNDVYGDAPEIILDGTLTRNAILSLLNDDGTTAEYAHLRFGCGDDDNGGGDECDLTDPTADCDGDGVLNGDDLCPQTAGAVEWDGCPDSDGDGVHDGIDECEGTAPGVEVDEVGCPINGGTDPEPCLPAPNTAEDCETVDFSQDNVSDIPYLLYLNGESIGNVGIDIDENDNAVITITMTIANNAYLVDDTEVIIGDYIECFDFNNEGEATMTIQGDYSFGFDLDMRVNVCPAI